MNTVSYSPATSTKTAIDRSLLKLGAGMVFGGMMSVLDSTVVNVATRTIGNDFRSSISVVQWVLTGYLLAFAAVVPVTGWASERFGARRLWLGSVLLFMVWSAMSGLAWSVSSLIVFRTLQGLFAGIIQSVSQAILAQAAGPRRMGRALSITSVPLTLAMIMGPIVGGFIVSTGGWRWIFFINLPLGAVAFLIGRRVLPQDLPQPHQRLDLRGLLLLSSGVAIFIYGISAASAQGGFGGPRFLAGMGTGTALIALYMVHARSRGRLALIDTSLLRMHNFGAVAAANFIVSAALYGVIVLQPLYWQIVRGEGPLMAGLLLTPQAIGSVLAIPLAAKVSDNAGARIVVPVGIIFILLGTAAYTQFGANTPYTAIAGALFMIGLGQGAVIGPITAAAYVMLSRDAIPRATAVIQTMKRIGASVGTAALAIVLDRAIKTGAPQLGDSALAALSPAKRAEVAPALADAFALAYWASFTLTAIAIIPTILLLRRASVPTADESRTRRARWSATAGSSRRWNGSRPASRRPASRSSARTGVRWRRSVGSLDLRTAAGLGDVGVPDQ